MASSIVQRSHPHPYHLLLLIVRYLPIIMRSFVLVGKVSPPLFPVQMILPWLVSSSFICVRIIIICKMVLTWAVFTGRRTQFFFTPFSLDLGALCNCSRSVLYHSRDCLGVERRNAALPQSCFNTVHHAQSQLHSSPVASAGNPSVPCAPYIVRAISQPSCRCRVPHVLSRPSQSSFARPLRPWRNIA